MEQRLMPVQPWHVPIEQNKTRLLLHVWQFVQQRISTRKKLHGIGRQKTIENLLHYEAIVGVIVNNT